MKKIILVLSAMFVNYAFASESIQGLSDQEIFEQLKGQREYSYSAITEFLRVDTVVRHNNEVSCEKETTTFKNAEPTIVFRCASVDLFIDGL